MLPPVTWKRQGFCCKKLCRNKAMVLHRRLRWEILENGGLFQVWLEAVWRPGRCFFFRKRLKLVSKWIQQCSPATICWVFWCLDEILKLWRMLHSRSSVFLSCFNDSEMCLRQFGVRVFLEIWFFYTGSSWTTWCFYFLFKLTKLSWKSHQQKSKLFQKQQPKTPINMMISQWKIQPSSKKSNFPADPCGNNEGENTQGRLQEQRLRRLRGKGAECRAQGMKLKTHPILWCDISCGFFQMVLSIISISFFELYYIFVVSEPFSVSHIV